MEPMPVAIANAPMVFRLLYRKLIAYTVERACIGFPVADFYLHWLHQLGPIKSWHFVFVFEYNHNLKTKKKLGYLMKRHW